MYRPLIIPNASNLRMDGVTFHADLNQFWLTPALILIDLCNNKHGGFGKLTLDTPFRPRSTGYKSANHHLRGHERQIASAVPCTMSEVHETIKDELADWPEKVIRGPGGERFIKASESEISSEVCAAAIELCHVWAAHLGITLQEGKNEMVVTVDSYYWKM